MHDALCPAAAHKQRLCVNARAYGIPIITDEAWDKLTPEQQDILVEAGKYASQLNREMSESEENKVLEELKAEGCTVVEVEDITPWQEACKAVIEENTADNKELYQQILDMQ